MLKIGQFFFSSGDPISCSIKGKKLENARIHVSDSESGQAWICHSNSEFDGDESPNRHGYRYSWTFYVRDSEITDEVSDIRPLFGVKQKKDVEISSDLKHFLYELSSSDKCDYFTLFSYEYGLFDEFNQYDIDDAEGFIILKNNRKKVQVKISRFIRQVGSKFNELYELSKIDVSDIKIEGLYNKFVAFQKQNQNIDFYSGQELLTGYKREHYHGSSGGTLHNSCMNDKLDFLKIYTENPKQVQLAVIYFDKKIAARTLIWTTTDGKRYHDRIYFTNDWLESLMKSKLRKLGIESIKDSGFKIVELEKWEFKNYPYIDSFYHFDKKNGHLLHYPENTLTLRSTQG